MKHYLKLMIGVCCIYRLAFGQIGFQMPIKHRNQFSFLYNNQTTISDKAFIDILKSTNNSKINHKLAVMRRNKFVRTGIHLASSGIAIIGGGTMLVGIMNSSGRNSYPQEKRAKAHFQTSLGIGIIVFGASFSLSTIFINIKNHKILHKDLVKLYNEQL